MTRLLKKIILSLIIFSSATICTAMPPQQEAQMNFEAGQDAEQKGDYTMAREKYLKALTIAEKNSAPPATISMLKYNYGRVSGYTCHFDEAEKYLLEALEMEKSVTGSDSRESCMRLFELSRLYYDQGKYPKAVEYYDQAITVAKKQVVEKSDPIALVNSLDEFADALNKTGNSARLEEIRAEAKRIRDINPGKWPKFIAVRYRCDQTMAPILRVMIEKAGTGDIEAQYSLGVLYDYGKGVPQNKTEAMKWYLMAAKSGHTEAQNAVGSMLQEEKRYSEALTWYEQAAAQGNAMAINNLGYLYDLGLGVKQDRQKGFELYNCAADLGYVDAMINIAEMYRLGQLGEKDLLSACVWILRAWRYAKANDEKVQNVLNHILPYLRQTLSEQDFALCRQKADAWNPKGDTQKCFPKKTQ